MYKRFFENKRAAFFDLDGTIIDSLPYWERACRIVLEDISEGTAPLYGISKGAYLGDIWKKTIREYDVETELSIEELVKKTHHEYLEIFKEEPLEPREGFWALADELKNGRKWSLALVSNSDRPVVTSVLKSLNINEGVFDVIITGDEVKHRKPLPDIYKKALKALKVKSKDVVVFEDSVSGAQAADKAGLDTIVIWDGVVPEPEYPKNTLIFLPEFSTIPGNLDTTFMEASRNRLKLLQSESS